MKRDEAVNKLRAARKDLLESLQDVSDEDRLRPNAVEKWSIKDLLAHIASWDEEVLRVVQAFAMQPEPHFSYAISDRSDFAAWNSEQVELRKERTLEQVETEFRNARRDLIQVVEGLTDQVLMRPKMTSWGKVRTGFELLEERVQHDAEHSKDVRSWRKKRERWARARQKYVSKRRETKKKEEEGEQEVEG
jgi:uncharacterized damage-inducible protein DinB